MKERSTVHLLSNYHNPYDVTVTRHKKDGTVTQVSSPQAFEVYNNHMNNVDKFEVVWSRRTKQKVVTHILFPPP